MSDATRSSDEIPESRTRRTLPQMYGYAFRKVVENGVDPRSVGIIYQLDSPDSVCEEEDAAFYFAAPSEWCPSEVLGCRWARGRVLDIGFGAGRHALVVAGDGHEVVGLEPSEDAVVAGRRRGVDARVGGILDPPADLGTFDTLLLLGGGLELLGVAEDPRVVLAALASLARPGAQIIGNFAAVLDDGTSLRGAPRRGGLRHMRYRLRVRHRGTLTDWSEWGGISFFLDPAELDAAVRGTAWGAPEISYPAWADVPNSEGFGGSEYDQHGGGNNLVRLVLRDGSD